MSWALMGNTRPRGPRPGAAESAPTKAPGAVTTGSGPGARQGPGSKASCCIGHHGAIFLLRTTLDMACSR